MALVVPPKGLALSAEVKSVNVVPRPGVTVWRPSMQNVVNVAGRPASRASPETFVQVNWPARVVRQVIGVAASPRNVTGRESGWRERTPQEEYFVKGHKREIFVSVWRLGAREMPHGSLLL
jgi:hypothetical protein